jgi:hypothetical protein
MAREHEVSGMPGRRTFVASLVVLGAGPALGQSASSFLGTWQGDVSGIGLARLFITGIQATGQVEGRMEFDLNSYVSTFGDKYDTTKNINHGLASGTTLTIEAALGGIYRLTLEDGRLSGTYSRGTTYSVPVTFTRI